MVNLVVLYAIYPGSNPGLPTKLSTLSSTVFEGRADNAVHVVQLYGGGPYAG